MAIQLGYLFSCQNWHSGDRTSELEYFKGSWYHGFSVLNIPANTSISLEYTSVNSLWEAFQQHLMHNFVWLVGDIISNGIKQPSSLGESITYEPDLHRVPCTSFGLQRTVFGNPKGAKWAGQEI